MLLKAKDLKKSLHVHGKDVDFILHTFSL